MKSGMSAIISKMKHFNNEIEPETNLDEFKEYYKKLDDYLKENYETSYYGNETEYYPNGRAVQKFTVDLVQINDLYPIFSFMEENFPEEVWDTIYISRY